VRDSKGFATIFSTRRSADRSVRISLIGPCVALTLVAVDVILRVRAGWFHALISLLNLSVPTVLLAREYRFVTGKFVPLYERLQQLCTHIGFPCAIRATRMRWLVRSIASGLLLAATLGITGAIFTRRQVLFEYLVLLCQGAVWWGLVSLSRRMRSTQDEADYILRSLEHGEPRLESLCPPRSAKFLLLLIPRRHREHLIGDLDEEYTDIVFPEYGPRKARIWYWWQVVASLSSLVCAEMRRLAGFIILWRSVR
jgi:hypothetical protein